MAAEKGNKYACKYTEKEMNALCLELVEWSHNSKSIHMASFTYEKFRKPRRYLYDMAEHYPQLKEALEQVKEILAMKMANACYNSNESGVNAVFGEKYLPIYNTDYKELLAWKAQLSKDKEAEDKQVVINVTNFGDKKIEVEE